MPRPCRNVLGLVLVPVLLAAGYEQRQGSAVLRLEGVTVEDGRASVRLADRLDLTVTVEGEPPLQFDKSDEQILQEQTEALQAAEVWLECKGAIERTKTADGREGWRLTFHLDPLRNTEVQLQLAPLSFTEGREKKPHRIEWEPVPLAITTEIAQPDLTELRDIPPPEVLPPGASRWLPWVVGIGLMMFGLVVVVLGWGLKRWRAAPEPVPTPEQWALQEIERVQALDLPGSGKAEHFHTLLSDILRRYFESRFRLPASHQTTDEFLRAVRAMPELSAPQQEQLREFLERCDLAKFARSDPTPEECQAAAVLARILVEPTTAVSENMESGTPANG